jgi:hypothetical protein
MFSNLHKFVRACQPCQLFLGKQHLASFPLQPVVVEASFQQWGLDFIGELVIDGFSLPQITLHIG